MLRRGQNGPADSSEAILLRRTQPISSQDEASPAGVERRRHPRVKLDAPVTDAGQSAPDGIERRRHPRVKLDTSDTQSDRNAAPVVERRKLERRSMDALRAELQRTAAPKVEDGILGAVRARFPHGLVIKPSRVVLLLVALLTGGLAAFLATRLDQQTVTPDTVIAASITKTQIVEEPRTQILVASQAIGVGQRLSPASLVWEDWPEGSVRSDYITLAALPGGIGEMSGAVARFEIFPGEPIREEKLARSDRGYLSAVLGSGQRGVSVTVTPETASGGFIVPNDRVDVVLTRDSPSSQVSQTIVSNVRVLTINSRLGETGATGAPADPGDPRAEIFTNEAIATLELDTAQAEVVIGATTLGKLSLVLRSMADFADGDQEAGLGGTNQAIRLTSPFWTQSSGETRLQ